MRRSLWLLSQPGSLLGFIVPALHTTLTKHASTKARAATMNAPSFTNAYLTIAPPAEWKIVSEYEEGDTPCIGTHSGTFHCDEALACAMLKTTPEWKDATIVRSRDPAILAKCGVVVDVGGVYDPENNRFDHHQKGFSDTMSELGFVTKLSSAGLVYRHYGVRVLKSILAGKCPADVIEKAVYPKVYKSFIEHVDGIDNGVNPFDGNPRYAVTSSLSSRVGDLNPDWNEPSDDSVRNKKFALAMALALSEFIDKVTYYGGSWMAGRVILEGSMNHSEESSDPSGQIIVLDQYCPWKGHLLDLEKERGTEGRAKFMVYAEGEEVNSKWRVQAIPVSEDSFESRLSLAEAWRGLRDEELSKVSGIPGGVFVHAAGFIGGNVTKEGALLMAKRSIEMADSMTS